MRVSESGRAGSPTRIRRPDRSGRDAARAFESHLSPDGTGAARGVKPAEPMAALDSMLAVQEVDGTPERRGRAISRGDDLLDRLDDLRTGILAGEVSASTLDRLRRSLRQKREGSGDPDLDGVLEAIEVRAAVEAAKLERAADAHATGKPAG